MKRISLLLALLLLLCAGCAKAPAEAELIFPPTEESLNAALDRAHLDWAITKTFNSDHTTIANYIMSNPDGTILSTVNSHKRPEGNELVISVGINTQTAEEYLKVYDKLINEDWPRIWDLAFELFHNIQNRDEIAALIQEWMKFAPARDEEHPETIEWRGSAGDVNCLVEYFYQESLDLIVPRTIHLNDYQPYQ